MDGNDRAHETKRPLLNVWIRFESSIRNKLLQLIQVGNGVNVIPSRIPAELWGLERERILLPMRTLKKEGLASCSLGMDFLCLWRGEGLP